MATEVFVVFDVVLGFFFSTGDIMSLSGAKNVDPLERKKTRTIIKKLRTWAEQGCPHRELAVSGRSSTTNTAIIFSGELCG